MKLEQWLQLDKLLVDSNIISVGEFGLDLSKHTVCPLSVQKNVMLDFILAAKRHDRSMVLHLREAYSEGIELLRNYSDRLAPMHFHCVQSDVSTMHEILQTFKNSYIGFTGAICSNNSHKLHKLAKQVPMERILLESDCPYFGLHGSRYSTPHDIEEIGSEISRLKNVNPRIVHEANLVNASKMYKRHFE